MFKFQKQIVDLDFLSIIIKGLINAIAILFAFKITEIVIYTLGYTEITTYLRIVEVYFAIALFFISCTIELIFYIRKNIRKI